jgi:hypothetical protein
MLKGRLLPKAVIKSFSLLLVCVALIPTSFPEFVNFTENQIGASPQSEIYQADEWEIGDKNIGAVQVVNATDQPGKSKVGKRFKTGVLGQNEVHLITDDIVNPGILDLLLDVNYGHDWVQGRYDPGHTVWITATEGDGSTVKGEAELWSGPIAGWGGETGFSTLLDGWSGEQPDLQSGDWILVETDNGYSSEVRIGIIEIEVDSTLDIVSGVIYASWFTDPLILFCEIWEAPGAPTIEKTIDPDGGSYSCDFGSAGWDIQPKQEIAVMYVDPVGNKVINTFTWPHLAAYIGPWSDGNRHVLGEGAEPEAMVPVTVKSDLGVFVAGTTVQADPSGRFNTGDDLPEGSLALWNQIDVNFGNAETDTLIIYPLLGLADPDTDVVTINAAGDPTFITNLEYCTLGKCNWIELGEIGLSGVVTVNLMTERGFDIQPGSGFHAHLYTWNGHEVIYSWGFEALESNKSYLPVILKK